MSEAPIVVRGLVAGYGRRTVIDGLDLTVAGGEVFGLVGLNGAGKTTLIKALLGMGQARGDIRVFGRPAGPPDSRTDLVYLPERFAPSPLLRGWEFLALTLAFYRLGLDREAARRLCAGLDLDDAALGRRGSTYSKGMGQKLGLLGTLLTARPLLVLDEPMSGLDPRARIMLKERLREYREGGRCVFFSSHILSDVEEICDRIAVIHRGALIFTGAPRDLIGTFGGGGLERAFLAAIARSEADRAA